MRRTRCFLLGVIGPAILAPASDGRAADGEAELWGKLTQLRQDHDRQQEAARRQAVERAGLQLAPCRCVAPIGDENEYGCFSRCFANVFPPEQDVAGAAREGSRRFSPPIREADRGPVQIAVLRVLRLSGENLITGGSFEPHGQPGDENHLPNAASRYILRGAGATTGRWVQSAGPAKRAFPGTGYQAQHGKQPYHPGRNHGEGKFSQSLVTIPDRQYWLSFYASGHPGADPVQSGTVSVGDLDVAYQTPTGTNIATDMGRRQQVFLFTAAEETSTLTFGSPARLQGTISIHNVEVRIVRGEIPVDSGRFAGTSAPGATKSKRIATKSGETCGLLLELAKDQSGRLRIGAGGSAADYEMDPQRTRLGFIFESADSTATLTVTNPGAAGELIEAYTAETIRLFGLPPIPESTSSRSASILRTRSAVV